MQYKMKELPDNVTLQDLFYHKSKTYRQMSRLFHSGAMYSAKDLAAVMDMSMASIKAALKVFREKKLIHIVRWDKPSNGGVKFMYAVYRMGKGEDAPKPEYMSQVQEQPVPEEPQSQAPQDMSIYQQLANALVPRRTEQEVHEVNQMYLNWISER